MMKCRLLVKLFKTANRYGKQLLSYKTGEMTPSWGLNSETVSLFQVNDIGKLKISVVIIQFNVMNGITESN